MTRSQISKFFILTFTFILTGCIATELKVTNRTGGVIQFYTGHTKMAVAIKDGATVTVPHTVGRIIIITQQDVVWQYDAIDVSNAPTETIKGYQKLTLPVSIDSSGSITLPSGRKVEPTQRLKPQQ